MKIYKLTKDFVKKSFADDKGGYKHLLRTVYWIKKLSAKNDEAVLVAAISHDIERAYRDSKKYERINKSKEGFKSKDHLKFHQETGAKIMADFLSKNGIDYKFIERVKSLISKHETGGNYEENLLKDADSISFFENNINHFLRNKIKETSVEKVRDKFDWMYQRITFKKARKIVNNWYLSAIDKLSKFENKK